MRQGDISQEVDALPEFADLDFVRVELEPAMLPKPGLNTRQERDKLRTVFGEDDRVIGVANVVSLSQILFDEVVECIHVDVGK